MAMCPFGVIAPHLCCLGRGCWEELRELLREDDSQMERKEAGLGRKKHWLQSRPDWVPQKTMEIGSDDDSWRNPVLLWSQRGWIREAVTAGSAQGTAFLAAEWQVLSLERFEWCLLPGLFKSYLIIQKNVSFKKVMNWALIYMQYNSGTLGVWHLKNRLFFRAVLADSKIEQKA